MAGKFVNVAGYKFVSWGDLGRRRRELRACCHAGQLKGTILLSVEGINFFVAGTRAGIDRLMDYFHADDRLNDMQVKESQSDRIPFSRMLVKVKREIITLRRPEIQPERYTSQRISPQQLREWLDQGKPVVLLDVRNDYEVELGSFSGATELGLKNFCEFPEAIEKLRDVKDTPVVTFCTGGIRCEKAAPLLEAAGMKSVYQLDGGILNYFQQCGGQHYEGECFVFDQRVAIDSNLKETGTVQCYRCQAPVTPAQQDSPLYRLGESCPLCYQDPEERMAWQIAQRHRSLRRVTDPLPGSRPYENRRPLHIGGKDEGRTLLDVLDRDYPFVGQEKWLERFALGMIQSERDPVGPQHQVRAGERFDHCMPNTVEPDVNADIKILFEDPSIVVVNKPAPLPMHPCGRYNRNTLVQILNRVYHPQKLRIAHRLDANTSGIVVFSRNSVTASRLQPQFETGEVAKQYVARVLPGFAEQEIVCEAPIGMQLAAAGARAVECGGREAKTHFKLEKTFPDGTGLMRVVPETGRTNQIRIHAWHLGFPVLGDPMYQAAGVVTARQTLLPTDPCMCLHAVRLSFSHPESGRRLTFETDLPAWACDNRRNSGSREQTSCDAKESPGQVHG